MAGPKQVKGKSRRSFLVGSTAGVAGLSLAARGVLRGESLEGAALSGVAGGAGRAVRGAASPFLLGWSEGTLTSLRFHGDRFPTEYIAPGERLGDVTLTWRRAGGAWQGAATHQEASAAVADTAADAGTPTAGASSAADPNAANTKVTSPIPGTVHKESFAVPHAGTGARYEFSDATGRALAMEVRLQTEGDSLRWSLLVRNLTDAPVEVGDLALPLPLHTEFKGGEPPTSSVLKHSFVSGHGSFLFWMRSNSVGPHLLMTPDSRTSLEFWESVHKPKSYESTYVVYLHSAARGEAVARAGGRWRQPHTSAMLAPAGHSGSERRYNFQLQWVPDYRAVEDRLAEAGLLDVQVAPGMTVPTDLGVHVALRSRNAVKTLEAEHPEQTKIEALGRRGPYQMYRVQFARLGENLLTVRQADGRVTPLEFFATEPVETLIQKRGAFIANHQQRDASKWYNGLLSEWNMDSGVMLGPDNYDRIKSWRIYEVTCDDPGLSKPAFLASKLAEFPDQAEATALDDYIEHFVWGGLQGTTEESDSYGIYGILDWKQNRDSADAGPKGKLHMWRPYDYPHIICMYWGMYRMARDFPAIHTRMTKAQYMERTYGTAMAFFTVPKRIIGWEAYETGFYNELVVPAIIDELERLGETAKAAALRTEWEKKLRFFVAGGPDLFGSEYAFDSTGFESTQALARYALDRTATGPGTLRLPAPDSKLKEGAAPFAEISRAEIQTFATTQMQANLFCRGVVEKAYYLYGSDYRAGGGDAYTLSYMAQMGGWAVMDHALHDRVVPDATVRLGYASYLSAWALMNTGTAASSYGYWYPGAANDGGAGGGFEPAAMGHTWLGQPHHRGSWYYSSEEDLGFCGALRAARTVLADDAVFGRFCFGGVVENAGEGWTVSPRDGVRRRFSVRAGGSAVDVELTGARFVRERAIEHAPGADAWTLLLEREPSSSGDVVLLAHGLPPKQYRVETDGQESVMPCADGVLRVRFHANATQARVVLRPA